jgi:hypothetical protein
VTVPDVAWPIGDDLDPEIPAGRARSWCRRTFVIVALSFPAVVIAGGSARAGTVTDTLDGVTTVAGVETGPVPDIVQTGSVDDAVSYATDQLSAAAAPIKQALDEQVASATGTVDRITRAAERTVHEAGDAIGETGPGLDTVVPDLDTAVSDSGGSRTGTRGSPGRIRPSLEAFASVGHRHAARSKTIWLATTGFDASAADPIDAHASSGWSAHLELPIGEPVPIPGLPVSMADGVGHTLLLMLIGMFVGSLAHASPGLRRNRPPPTLHIPFVLVLSLERPG